MDYTHIDLYNDLLIRKCPCGGCAEMLMDFVSDFVVRCKACHLSTHAYIRPEDAAMHWNLGDDIMPDPLDILLDDPETALQGEIIAIQIRGADILPITHQSCDFDEVILEYKDKLFLFQHEKYGDTGLLNIERITDYNSQIYNISLRPKNGEQILFDRIIYSENNTFEGTAYRWGDDWLFVYGGEYNLVMTKSSFDLEDDNAWPVAVSEPDLFTNELSDKLLELCFDINFNSSTAENLARYVNLNRELIDPKHPNSRTSFLSVACLYNNIKMVEILLRNGADPNFILHKGNFPEEESPFWDLQYNYSDDPEENKTSLQIAQLMLDYGANPNIVVSGEDLFSYVLFAVFEQDDTPITWEHRSKFLILLIAYGGKNSYCTPNIIVPFDKTCMAQYEFALRQCEDGYHFTGEIWDWDYEVVAEI